MEKLNTISKIRGALKLFGLAVAASVAFLAGNAQAATTTTVINLGTSPSYTTIVRSGSPYTYIPAGTLPVGSILRSVSWNVELRQGDPYLGDLAVYIAEGPDVNPALQVGGVGTCIDGSEPYQAPIQVSWNAGCAYAIGTKASTTLTDVDGIPPIDLNAYTVYLESTYGSGGYAGTITLEYDLALGVTVTNPPNGYGYVPGTSITAAAIVQEPNPALTDTVTFHTTPISPAGPTVDTVSTSTTSPFTADLGALPAGTYQIYATVANNDSPPGSATSTANTFTVAAISPTTTTLTSSANPSTYGQLTLTATVTPPPTGGTVQFYNGASALGSPVTVNTSTGEAQLNANTLGAGTNDLTAAYSGHILLAASTSDVLTQVVDKAELTVKALDVLRAPNTANPDPLPYQIFGYQNGETLATSGVTGTPTLTTTAVLSSPVGTYDITCALGSLVAANYSFTTLVNGTLTVAVVANTFSVNFYVGPDWPYGGLTTDEQKANLLLGPSVPAGLSGWYATGWRNFLVPWAPTAPLAPVTLTSTLGSEATFIFKDCRNGWTYNGPRTTMLGDGNGNMMDGHVNSTLDPGDGSNLFDMEVSNIPFAVYDVIFYIGANQAQYGDGTGVIVFNGGAERGFTVKPGAFDGTFTEMVDETTPGNYIVFTKVTGASFTTQTWGIGFNHVGPFGFQIRYSPDPAEIVSFAAAGRVGVIDRVALTINVSVPYGTDLATLAPTFTLSSGACTPTSGTAPTPSFAVQNPATYTVIDGATTRVYNVTITVDPARTENVMSNVLFPGIGHAWASDATGTNFVLVVPCGTVVTALAPTYSVSPGASGSPGTGTPLNFTTPQTYTITAEDGSKAHYSVEVRTEGTYVNTILADGPAGYWPLYETSGTVAADLGISGLAGTYNAANVLGLAGPGTSDGFLGFTGAPQYAVGLAGNATPSPVVVPALNLTGNNVTILCWINPDVIPQADRTGLFTCTGPSTSSGLRFNSGTAAGSGLALVWNNTLQNLTPPDALTVPANQWSFAAATVTPTLATIYLGTTNNGLQSGIISGSFVNQPFSSPGLIGSDRNTGGRYFQGRMAHVAVFDYALTPAQIAQVYAAGVALPTLHITQPDALGHFTISGVTGAGLSVHLWKSIDLSLGAGGWTEVQTVTADGCSGAFTFPVTETDVRAFYRVK